MTLEVHGARLSKKKKYEIFGKYILLERIAMGGMAEIFLSRNHGAAGISKFSAIKRILPQFSANKDFVRMFKDEAKINMNLSHGNIVSIYDFGEEQDHSYIVMDYINGKNLRQVLNRVNKSDDISLSVDQIVYIIKEIASGLNYAHHCLDRSTGKPLNIIHRDISPQNIMLSFDGEVKVVDFGIAKAETQEESTKAGTLKGKFAYMSPEQVSGEAIDLRTDIFSLGIVLWELLAKDRLFIASNELNTLKKIGDCKIPSLQKLNPEVSEQLDNIVNKSLTKSPNNRYQTCEEFQKELNRFLNINYPDFSSNDFASLIKSLYSEEIFQTQKKLISYSKINFEPRDSSQKASLNPKDEDKTLTALTETDADMGSHIDEDYGSAFKLNEKSEKINVNFKGITVVRTNPKNSSTSGGQYKSLNQLQKEYRSPLKRKKSSFGPFKALVVLCIIAGIALVAAQLTPFQKITGSKELSSLAQKSSYLYNTINSKFVIIRSKPQGAKVFINGRNTEKLTPARIQIPSNENYIFSLSKTGFKKYQQKILANNPETIFLANLKSIPSGYLDIDIKPRSKYTRIYVYIDGVPIQIKQPVPIESYRVQAGKRIVVRAENTKTRSYDQTKPLILSRNQRKKVTLRPRYNLGRK